MLRTIRNLNAGFESIFGALVGDSPVRRHDLGIPHLEFPP